MLLLLLDDREDRCRRRPVVVRIEESLTLAGGGNVAEEVMLSDQNNVAPALSVALGIVVVVSLLAMPCSSVGVVLAVVAGVASCDGSAPPRLSFSSLGCEEEECAKE